MIFQSEIQALEVVDNIQAETRDRELAIRFVTGHPTPQAIQHLVHVLEDDDFGVRWEAAVGLAQVGALALPELLKALVDPHRVSDPRLREGAYHILHYNRNREIIDLVKPLMAALKGPASGIATLEAANAALMKLESQQRLAVGMATSEPRPSRELGH